MLAAGCGNYSNEDLEFTTALPERSQLAAVIPVRSSIIGPEPAELYRLSRTVALVFNGIVDAFLTLVDGIRAFPPTTRAPNLRVWGPFPAENQPECGRGPSPNLRRGPSLNLRRGVRCVGADWTL